MSWHPPATTPAWRHLSREERVKMLHRRTTELVTELGVAGAIAFLHALAFAIFEATGCERDDAFQDVSAAAGKFREAAGLSHDPDALSRDLDAPENDVATRTWREAEPTFNEISAHAKAHPWKVEAFEGGPRDGAYQAGLWMVRNARRREAATFVALYWLPDNDAVSLIEVSPLATWPEGAPSVETLGELGDIPGFRPEWRPVTADFDPCPWPVIAQGGQR